MYLSKCEELVSNNKLSMHWNTPLNNFTADEISQSCIGFLFVAFIVDLARSLVLKKKKLCGQNCDVKI